MLSLQGFAQIISTSDYSAEILLQLERLEKAYLATWWNHTEHLKSTPRDGCDGKGELYIHFFCKDEMDLPAIYISLTSDYLEAEAICQRDPRIQTIHEKIAALGQQMSPDCYEATRDTVYDVGGCLLVGIAFPNEMGVHIRRADD